MGSIGRKAEKKTLKSEKGKVDILETHNTRVGKTRQLGGWWGRREESCGFDSLVWGWRRWTSVDVELVRKVMEDLVGGTGQTAGGGEREVGGDEQVEQVLGGDLAGDGAVIAGRAGVFQDGLVGGREPKELEDGALDAGVCCAQVVERGVGFGESGDAGKVEGRGGGVLHRTTKESWNGTRWKSNSELKVTMEEHSKRQRQELQALSQSSAGSN